mgnify:CR=1 FL=1
MLGGLQHSKVRQNPPDMSFRYNAVEMVEVNRRHVSSDGIDGIAT